MTTSITDLPVAVYDPASLGEPLTEVAVGDTVVAHVRGRYRAARVTKLGPKRATVECTTPTAIDEAWKIAAYSREQRNRGERTHQLANAERYERDAEWAERFGIAPANGDSEFVALADLPAEYVALAADAHDRRTGRMFVVTVEQWREWAASARSAAAKCDDTLDEARAYDARPLAEKAAEHVNMTTKSVLRAELYPIPA
jgi:hypothetical protein